MTTTEIRDLNAAELEQVSGGMWKECANGTTRGGAPGVYPSYVDCAQTWAQFYGDFREVVFNGGRPL